MQKLCELKKGMSEEEKDSHFARMLTKKVLSVSFTCSVFLVGVWSVSGGCLESVWKVVDVCLQAIKRGTGCCEVGFWKGSRATSYGF